MLNKKRSYEVVGIFLPSKDRQANKWRPRVISPKFSE